MLAEPDELHEVRCCSDTKKDGWKKHGHCDVWAQGVIPGLGCLEKKTLAEAASACIIAGGRLCSKDEAANNCMKDSGCPFNNDYVWTKSVGFEEVKAEPTALDPYVGVEKYWLACADRTDDDCVRNEGANSIIAAVVEQHEVVCCADSPKQDWKASAKVPGVWATAMPDGNCVHAATFIEAFDICDAAGGRLCQRDELLDLAAKEAAGQCNHKKDLVWTSTEAPVELDWMNWVACGEKGKCAEMFGWGGRLAAADEFHEVRCCTESYHAGWKKHGHCDVWALSVDCDRTYALEDAMALCEAAGARLCTKQELVRNCAKDAGCGHNDEFLWTQTPGWKPSGPAEIDMTLEQDDKFYLACANRMDDDCVRNEGANYMLAAVSEKHEVMCCADKNLGSLWKESSRFPGVWASAKPDGVCIHSASYQEATETCEGVGGRLCSKDELMDLVGLEAAGTCDHKKDLVWSSTNTTYDISTGQNWVACGERTKCKEHFGYGARLAKKTELHEVRCCSDEFHAGWKRHGHCSVWAWSKFDGFCYYSETFENAEKVCAGVGARLCTKQELVSNCAKDAGPCGFDDDFLWTSTPGWEEINVPALPDPRDDQDKYWIACADRLDDDCVRHEGANSIVAAVSEEHEVMCCSESKLDDTWKESSHLPGVWASAKPTGECIYSATYSEAEAACSSVQARLCTRDELLGLGAKNAAGTCNHKKDLVWSSTPSDGDLDKMNWVSCGERGKCNEIFGWGARLAPKEELHEIRCCSDDYHAGWKKHGHCDVWAWSVGNCSTTYTLDDATAMCEAQGARLCTKEELVANCGNDAGCGHDDELVWTQSTGWIELDDSQANAFPSDAKVMLACNDPTRSDCSKLEGSNSIIAAVTEQHEVSCCSSTAVTGDTAPYWTQLNGCDIWTASELPVCVHSATFADAEAICENHGGRLCSADEVLSGCARTTKCDHKKDLVWTDTVVTTTLATKQWATCGKGYQCGMVGGILADPSEEFDVKCCSEEYHSGWKRNGSCTVWGESNVPQCYKANLADAKQICADVGARLCTRSELAKNCAANTGCGSDNVYVWTSNVGWEEIA